MRRFAIALTFALLLSAPVLFARVELLLVPPPEAVTGEAGLRFTLYLNNPTAFPGQIVLPRVLEAVCSSGGVRQRVQLEAVGDAKGVIKVPAATRVTVDLRLKNAIVGASSGFVSLRLEEPESNAIMFELKPATPPAAVASAPSARAIDLANDIEIVSRHISAYEPIYLVAGWRGGLNARFQFSFKYRLLEERPDHDLDDPRDRTPWPLHLARDLHVAYTQTSLWDLDSPSKPFYDTSYKPTLFLLHRLRGWPGEIGAATLQYGVQHESNGKAGTTVGNPSRSLNTLYVAPTFRWWDAAENFFLEVRPRAIAYFHLDDNRDLARYRGHLELSLRAGRPRGAQLAVLARGSLRGRGSLELNATFPVANLPWPGQLKNTFVDPRAALGGYLQVQYFNGYGESLLDYNVRRRDQLRFGFTLVREPSPAPATGSRSR